MIEVQVHDSTLRAVRLAWAVPDGQDEAAATNELLAATQVLARDWLEPIGVGFRVDCCDPEGDMQASDTVEPPQRAWWLQQAEVPSELDLTAPFGPARTIVEPALDAATIARWVAEATTQRCAGGLVAALGELWWTSVRARVPVDDQLSLKDGPYPVTTVIEERPSGRWAVGPVGQRTSAPITLRTVNWHGLLTISLAVHWTLWIDHPAMVDHAIARVLARPGWERR